MTLTLEITDAQLNEIARRGYAEMPDRASWTVEEVKAAYIAAYPVLFDSTISNSEEVIGAAPQHRTRVFNEALGLPGVGLRIESSW